ncbi:MAG TPA: PorV/PorQ family protein, partial [Candidatus Sabulitectum sp.]|nr:PorV/PorQ family protein [Candidatus Sabulitectum sp.]
MKRTSMILATALVAFLLFPAVAHASFAKVGTSGAQFLKIGVGCRGVAMGGAFVATADDPSAAYWNPGALVRVPGTQFQFTGTQLYGDILYGNGIVTHEMQGIGTFALQFGLLSSGDMDLTTVSNPDGGETFTCSDMVVGVSFGRMLTDRFSAGMTAKYVRESWDDISAGGVAVDLGTLYDTGFKTLRIGMSIQHFGPELQPSG